MINTNSEFIVPYELPNITVPIGQGECFDDVLMLSLRSLNHWFLEPNKVKILETYKLGVLPLLVVRYANKKLALLIEYIQDNAYYHDSKVDRNLIDGQYTEALRTFALENHLIPVVAVLLSHTNKKDIEKNEKFFIANIHNKKVYIVEPILMIAETPPNQVRIKYPYPLNTKGK
jgi:hypothetical protein